MVRHLLKNTVYFDIYQIFVLVFSSFSLFLVNFSFFRRMKNLKITNFYVPFYFLKYIKYMISTVNSVFFIFQASYILFSYITELCAFVFILHDKKKID